MREEDDDGDTEAWIRALWPRADSKYRMCTTDGQHFLDTSLDATTCSRTTYAAYLELIKDIYGAEKKPSPIQGQGIFVTKDVPAEKFVIEYTGIRRSGASAKSLNRAFDYRELCPHGLVSVYVDEGDEPSLIDPRLCGNIAKFVNHSCRPNCQLEMIIVHDRYVVTAW